MDSGDLYELLKKYREGSCSPEESARLNAWYEESGADVERISAVPGEKLAQLFYGIRRATEKTGKTLRRGKTRLTRRIAAIASVAAVIAVALYLHKAADCRENAISIGYRQAILTVGNGKSMALNETSFVEEGGRVVADNTGNMLDYSDPAPGASQDTYHTITVPIGGEFTLKLSDGSRVHLNSGSRLTYPVIFGDGERRVTLEGEGYFEVARSTELFVLSTNILNIEVLGTSFNVSAYDDDAQITTTLVSGSVAIGDGHGRRHVLSPGSRFSYDKATGTGAESECDTSLDTSWTEGRFRFMDMRMEDIMKKLCRWYDCDAVLDDDLKDMRISGAAEKNKPVEYVLNMIEYVTDISFTIECRTITVTRK